MRVISSNHVIRKGKRKIKHAPNTPRPSLYTMMHNRIAKKNGKTLEIDLLFCELNNYLTAMKGRVTTKASVKWIPFLCVFCFALGILFSNRSAPSLHPSFFFPFISDFYICLSFYLPLNLVHELHRACRLWDSSAEPNGQQLLSLRRNEQELQVINEGSTINKVLFYFSLLSKTIKIPSFFIDFCLSFWL